MEARPEKGPTCGEGAPEITASLGGLEPPLAETDGEDVRFSRFFGKESSNAFVMREGKSEIGETERLVVAMAEEEIGFLESEPAGLFGEVAWINDGFDDSGTTRSAWLLTSLPGADDVVDIARKKPLQTSCRGEEGRWGEENAQE